MAQGLALGIYKVPPEIRKGVAPGVRALSEYAVLKLGFFSQVAMSRKQCKIGPTLLLISKRKLHTHVRLVPKSTTLDDLEQPLCTLFQNIRFAKPVTKI